MPQPVKVKNNCLWSFEPQAVVLLVRVVLILSDLEVAKRESAVVIQSDG